LDTSGFWAVVCVTWCSNGKNFEWIAGIHKENSSWFLHQFEFSGPVAELAATG
jgi:hypothetical protein